MYRGEVASLERDRGITIFARFRITSMAAPEETRKQIALTSLSTLPDSTKGFWWTDDDLAIILAASVGQPGPLNRLYRTGLDWAGGGLRGADKVFPAVL